MELMYAWQLCMADTYGLFDIAFVIGTAHVSYDLCPIETFQLQAADEADHLA